MKLELAIALGMMPGLLVGFSQRLREWRTRRARAQAEACIAKRRYEWRKKSGNLVSDGEAANACVFYLEAFADGKATSRTPKDEADDPEKNNAMWVHVATTGEKLDISKVGNGVRLANEPDLPVYNRLGRVVKG
jgi:hypothetical protein